MTLYGANIEGLLSSDRITNLIKYSQYCYQMNGYAAEFGVFSGGSLEIIARFNPGKEIIAVDSFSGMPPITEGVDYHKEGDFDGVPFQAINGYFKMMYPNVRIVKGFIPQVFEFFDEHTRFCFSHIDLDLYQSIKDTLDFVLPRTTEGGIILLDDYKVRSTPGCEKAINDFFEEHETEVNYRGELKYWDAEDAKSHNQYLIIR